MTTTEQPGPEEREVELEKLRKRMARAMRRGNAGRYEELRVEHDRLKQAHMDASLEEHKARVRAGRAVREAVRALEEPSRVWRLPRGFSSPLAAERAREGRRAGWVVPVGRPALSPWRRGPVMSEVIWNPGGRR